MQLNKEHQYSDVYGFPYPDSRASWLRMQATFHCDSKEWNVWKMAQFTARVYNKGKQVKENWIRVYRLLNDGETKDISFDMKVSDTHFDSVDVRFWNPDSDKKITVDNIKVWGFN